MVEDAHSGDAGEGYEIYTMDDSENADVKATTAAEAEGEVPETVLLPAASDFANAEAIMTSLRACMDTHGAITVDVKNVDRVTTPIAQLLIAAHKSLAKQGGALKVVNSCDEFTDCLSDLGLGEWLEKWGCAA